MKVAIVGTGISGLATAYMLDGHHDLTLYESNNYAGGHSNTISVETDERTHQVDTGFIVFNKKNYEKFYSLLEKLNVDYEETGMGFSFSDRSSGFEYSGDSIRGLLAQWSNLFNFDFWSMVWDLIRFYRSHRSDFTGDESITLGEYLSANNYSRSFKENHLLPMASAIWSTPPENIRNFPIGPFLDFFQRHGLLEFFDRPPWYHLVDGARDYVQSILEEIDSSLMLETPVESIQRNEDFVKLWTKTESHQFDSVVIGTHADTALELLEEPSQQHRNILESFSYEQSHAYVHSDVRFMPENKNCWSAWNYVKDYPAKDDYFVTYDLNRLQNFDSEVPIFETIVPDDTFSPNHVYEKLTYSHPRYSSESFQAQEQFEQINGHGNVYFCGAYRGFGFHEDGVESASAVARNFTGSEIL